MKKWTIYILGLLLFGCTDIEKQNHDAEELANQRFEEIEDREVDQYPLMGECDELGSVRQQRDCFYRELGKEISSRMDSITLPVSVSASDSVSSLLVVDREGQLRYEGIQGSLSQAVSEKLDSLLRARFENLPKVEPAIKRGVPVRTEFSLPIVIKPSDTLVR